MKLNYLARPLIIAGICAIFLTGILQSTAFGADTKADENLHTYSTARVTFEQHAVMAESFNQNVQVKVFLPPENLAGHKRLPSLYINDGQDADAVALATTLQRLYDQGKIDPVIVVAVSMLPDRMATYGYSDRSKQLNLLADTRYGPVGNQAHAYSEWLALELVPYIDRHYRTITKPKARAILGWSLGAANAFNIGWNYPDVFSRVGAFSPSFWLSAKSGDPTTAIVQNLLKQKPVPAHFSLWLAVGDAEETDDRDGDGVIDVVDDSQGVIETLSSKAVPRRVGKVQNDIRLTLFPGGQHNQQTWKQMLPEFLLWAYPLDN